MTRRKMWTGLGLAVLLGVVIYAIAGGGDDARETPERATPAPTQAREQESEDLRTRLAADQVRDDDRYVLRDDLDNERVLRSCHQFGEFRWLFGNERIDEAEDELVDLRNEAVKAPRKFRRRVTALTEAYQAMPDKSPAAVTPEYMEPRDWLSERCFDPTTY